VQHLVEALDRIRETGMSVLVVEQSPHVIADLVDRVYLLEQGRVVGHGTLKEVGGADAIAELYLGVK
jgi:branched-chain amino acid transport system ATP-binding protein